MKIFALIVGIVYLLVVPLGVGLLLAVNLSDGVGGALAFATTGGLVLAFAPALVGSYLAFGPSDISGAAGQRFRRNIGISIAVSMVLGIGLLVTFTVLTGEAVWLPMVGAVAFIALTAAALGLGEAVRRLPRKERAGRPEPLMWSPQVLRRKRGIVAITFVVAFGVALIIFAALGSTAAFGNGGEVEALFSITFVVLSLCFIAAATAALIVSWPLNQQMRDVLHSAANYRAIPRVVLRGKSLSLSDDQERRAVEYARLAGVYLPFQALYFALLYLGLLCQQLRLVLFEDGFFQVLGIVFCIALVVGLVVFVPLLRRQQRRAEAYAQRALEPQPEPAASDELG